MHHSQPTSTGLVPVSAASEPPVGRVLLVGAGGFIGGHLASAAERVGLDLVRTRRDPEEHDLGCDLLDSASVLACVEAVRPDHVINAAGSASVAESWRDPAATYAINALGTARLLEALAGARPEAHLLCISSAQVYGEPPADGAPFVEDDPIVPVTPYGESKAAMEELAHEYERVRGLRVATARLFNQVGPGQPPEQAAAGFAREIAAAERSGAERVELTLNNPSAGRDFTDVRETAMELLEISGRRLSGPYNVCSGRVVAMTTVVEVLAGLTPLSVEVATPREAERPPEPASSHGDPGRLRAATGWEPRAPLERSLADLLEWSRAQPADAA